MSDDRIVVIPRSKLSSVAIFLGIGLLIGIGVIGYLAYKRLMEENIKLKNEVTQFKTLTETLVRSSTQWATKKTLKEELKSLLKPEDLKALHDDIKKQGARLSVVGKTVGSLSRKVAKLEATDRTGPVNTDVVTCSDGRLIDVHKYTKAPQIKRLKDNNNASVADVEFNAAKAKPWSYELFTRKYKLATVVSKKDSGQLVFHHNLKYNSSADGDKEYPIKLTSSSFKQAQLGSKFFWLNPKLDFNFFIGGRVTDFALGPGNPSDIVSFGADLGVSLSSYGETKIDSWWRMFRFGIGYDAQRQAGHLSFAPTSFNLGKLLPLISNMYLAPQIGIDTAGGVTIGLGIGPQL